MNFLFFNSTDFFLFSCLLMGKSRNRKEKRYPYPRGGAIVNRTNIVEPLDTKRMIVRDFCTLIETLPNQDDAASIQKFLRYLQSLLRIKQVIPPMVEIMTIIKSLKPTLYHSARRTIMPTSNLHMLFQLEMDMQLAQERLRQYDK